MSLNCIRSDNRTIPLHRLLEKVETEASWVSDGILNNVESEKLDMLFQNLDKNIKLFLPI